jgi:hypothetical protein
MSGIIFLSSILGFDFDVIKIIINMGDFLKFYISKIPDEFFSSVVLTEFYSRKPWALWHQPLDKLNQKIGKK